ncbi:MAG: hypothetical protein IJ935_07260 [Afipia sp.]|nr:hypothetical protein [Afipia sp.]
MKRAVVFAVCVGWISSAAAAFDDGNDLLQICTNEREFCLGLTSGYYDMMRTMGVTCPRASNVSRGQVRDVIVKYLNDNPAKRNQSASFLAATALTQGFGCKKPGT